MILSGFFAHISYVTNMVRFAESRYNKSKHFQQKRTNVLVHTHMHIVRMYARMPRSHKLRHQRGPIRWKHIQQIKIKTLPETTNLERKDVLPIFKGRMFFPYCSCVCMHTPTYTSSRELHDLHFFSFFFPFFHFSWSQKCLFFLVCFVCLGNVESVFRMKREIWSKSRNWKICTCRGEGICMCWCMCVYG